MERGVGGNTSGGLHIQAFGKERNEKYCLKAQGRSHHSCKILGACPLLWVDARRCSRRNGLFEHPQRCCLYYR